MSTYQEAVFTNGAIHAIRCLLTATEKGVAYPLRSHYSRGDLLKVVNSMPIVEENGEFQYNPYTGEYSFIRKQVEDGGAD